MTRKTVNSGLVLALEKGALHKIVIFFKIKNKMLCM